MRRSRRAAGARARRAARRSGRGRLAVRGRAVARAARRCGRVPASGQSGRRDSLAADPRPTRRPAPAGAGRERALVLGRDHRGTPGRGAPAGRASGRRRPGRQPGPRDPLIPVRARQETIMNPTWTLSVFAPVCALALCAAPQQPPVARKLTRVPVQDLKDQAQQPERARKPDAPVADDWKKRLSDSDLERRESAFDEVVERARGDRELRKSLEQTAQATDAPELAWTARMALRELRRAAPNRAFDDLRQRFDALERNFGGMDSMFEDLRSQLGTFPALPPHSRGTTQQFQGYSLQIGPDGVTLESTENTDGNGEKKTYKAKDMQELLQNYPELKDKIGGSEHFDLQGGPGGWFFLRDGLPENDWLRSPRPSQQPPTDVLGIYSQKLTPEQAKELELEPEQGLRIESVKPGTIAQILGLRRGDTIVELDGQPIY